MEQDFNKMVTLERELEKRFERSCERNGWTATAYLHEDAGATRMLEKISEKPIAPDDVLSAHTSISDFITAEIGIPDIVDDKVFSTDEEKIPNTIAPYHITLTARIDASRWLSKAA